MAARTEAEPQNFSQSAGDVGPPHLQLPASVPYLGPEHSHNLGSSTTAPGCLPVPARLQLLPTDDQDSGLLQLATTSSQVHNTIVATATLDDTIHRYSHLASSPRPSSTTYTPLARPLSD